MNQLKHDRKRSRMLARTAALIVVVLSVVLAGCGNRAETPGDGKWVAVTTFYPLYFLAQAIGGDDARVINLVPAGVDPHDWTPKSGDLKTISEAQLFIYNGAELEGWTSQFLKGLPSDSALIRVEASKGIDLIVADGHDHGDDAHAHDDNGHDHGHSQLGVDPHTWVSPRSALQMAANIRDAFIQADPANKSDYEQRYQSLQAELVALDEEFAAALAPYQGKEIVVSHQAFAYLCRDYGLKQTAVMGLSPDAEPQAQDMIRIIKHIKENQIRYIFFEALTSNVLAETIAQETGARTLVLNPVEGLTPEQEQAGENYVTLMRENLQNLQKALQ
jgi:zinc transport system substrate-binding protein